MKIGLYLYYNKKETSGKLLFSNVLQNLKRKSETKKGKVLYNEKANKLKVWEGSVSKSSNTMLAVS